MITGQNLEILFRRYLTDHSARRINYMFWNVIDLKETTIQLVNLSGKELIRSNTPDLIYRSVKFKNHEDWAALKEFIDTYIIDPDLSRVVYVIRLDHLASYLKSINFDVNRIKLTRTGYGTIFTIEEKPKVIATIDPDIQSIYLLDNFHNTYRRALYGNEETWDIKDITEEYLNDPEFKFKIGSQIVLPVVENLDAINRKVLRTAITKDPKTKLEQIYIKNGLTAVTSRFTTDGVIIVNVRVYLLCYPNKKKK